MTLCQHLLAKGLWRCLSWKETFCYGAFFFPWWESSWCLFGKLSVFSSFANTNLPVSQSSKGDRTGLKLSGSNPPVRGGERALIIPTCARLQWEGQDEAISCLSTGTTKSLYTSVSYFLFWHNQSSKLSRHDRIWQLPRTLAKLDKAEGGETQRKGDELALFSPPSLLVDTQAQRVA